MDRSIDKQATIDNLKGNIEDAEYYDIKGGGIFIVAKKYTQKFRNEMKEFMRQDEDRHDRHSGY